MCGIAGWVGHLHDGEKYAGRMAQALRHRGPDARGIWSANHATLIHTRLSIIDLSRTGAQPMANEDGTVLTVFNGEIYNHREIRSALERRGHVFRGQSDTEVLPHLYEEEGWAFVSRLRGMFAFAIYDCRKRQLLLARDRFGIKPLFYATSGDRLVFASEISALLEVPGIDDRPNAQAISDFAALFYIPAPYTFYSGIQALCPGEVLVTSLDNERVRCTSHRHHRWSTAPDPAMTLDDATERAAELLTAAVSRQKQSDVPLGALLSGGIDSSLVSVAAQASLGSELRTFNVRFADSEYDETFAALAVAQHIGSAHTTLDMEEVRGTWEHVTGLLCHAGQPFADTSLFAANAVCREMRRHVTVALSGDGGDEGFGGYPLFHRIGSVDWLRRLPVPVLRGVSTGLEWLRGLPLVPASLPKRIQSLAGADDVSILQDLLCWVRVQEHDRLCRDLGTLPVRRLFESEWQHQIPSGASRLERLSAHATEIYTRLVLPNDYLFKVDTASMRESLEVRVPLLDEDLFAFGLTLPHELKARRGTCKRVLRSVAKRWLPEDVARKPKRGFAIPVDHWVEPDFKPRLRASLLGHSTALADFLRPESYRPIIDAFCSGTPYPGVSRQGLYQRAIMLLSLHLTLERRARRAGSQPADTPEPPSVVRTDGQTLPAVMSAASASPLRD